MNKNFEVLLEQLTIPDLVQDFSTAVFSVNLANKKGQVSFFNKLIEHINYDDYELLELLVASFTPTLFEAKSIGTIKELIITAVEFEAEETIEKLLWFISLQETKVISSLESELIEVVENISGFDRSIYALKILARNILTLDRIKKLPKLYASFVSEIMNGDLKSYNKQVIDIWNNEPKRSKKLTKATLTELINDNDIDKVISQSKKKACKEEI